MRRGAKYNSVRTPCALGVMHASGSEARCCNERHLMQKAGIIRNLQAHPQPSWNLEVNGVHIGEYTADFEYEDVSKGTRIVEDHKGAMSRDVPLRLKLMKALHGIDVYLSGMRPKKRRRRTRRVSA